MFTGIVKDTVEVTDIREAGEGKRITVSGSDILETLERGESISVSGTCLTVEEPGESVEIFLAGETLRKTWFSDLKTGDSLNIEPALRPTDRMGGHIVQGHVEDSVEVVKLEELEEGVNMYFRLPEELSDYIVSKGFVTVEGISLTVTCVEDSSFGVTVIPETLDTTNLPDRDEGDPVNLETDVTARYIEKMAD